MPLTSLALTLALATTDAPPPPPQRNPMIVALDGGFGYQQFIGTSFYDGFGELRLGGQRGRVEMTGRLRLQAGLTQHGLVNIQVWQGFGLLGVVHPRVRIGVEFDMPFSLMFIRRASNNTQIGMGQFALLTEVQVDLLRSDAHVLYLSARAGLGVPLSISLGLKDLLSPNVLVGVGYRFSKFF